jgi:hypothetical protein
VQYLEINEQGGLLKLHHGIVLQFKNHGFMVRHQHVGMFTVIHAKSKHHFVEKLDKIKHIKKHVVYKTYFQLLDQIVYGFQIHFGNILQKFYQVQRAM